jgi:hypothetical protein
MHCGRAAAAGFLRPIPSFFIVPAAFILFLTQTELAAGWHLAAACVFRRRIRLANSPLWAAMEAVWAEGLLLRLDTVERAAGRDMQGRAGTVRATGDAGWRAGAWDEQTHEQTQRDEQSHKSKHEQTLGRNKL